MKFKPDLNKVRELTRLPKGELELMLEQINKEALSYLDSYRKRWEDKLPNKRFHPYKWLQRSSIWRDAKEIHMAYNLKQFTILLCTVCFEMLENKECELHHYKYDDEAYFTYCIIVCPGCHKDIHDKKS